MIKRIKLQQFLLPISLLAVVAAVYVYTGGVATAGGYYYVQAFTTTTPTITRTRTFPPPPSFHSQFHSQHSSFVQQQQSAALTSTSTTTSTSSSWSSSTTSTSTRLLLVKQQHSSSTTTNTKLVLAAAGAAAKPQQPQPPQESRLLTPIEKWCVIHMDLWYTKSLRIKCPFIKRRTADVLDGVDMLMRFVLVQRHKSLPTMTMTDSMTTTMTSILGPPPGCRSRTMSKTKHTGLDTTQISRIIQRDWRHDTDHKGYYITGRLNTTIYRDDCIFDGPDPDMPVKGLRKYLNAASHLFDHETSTAVLNNNLLVVLDETTIQARWTIQGVLHLPWHPKLPEWTGTTTYHLDEQRLIYLHEETWDMSVWQAFTQTFLPQVADTIWNTSTTSSASASSASASSTQQHEAAVPPVPIYMPVQQEQQQQPNHPSSRQDK